MLQITLGITGDEELAAAFQSMARRVTDWTPFWPAIAGVFYESERARFASDGFGTWPRLSDGSTGSGRYKASGGYAAWKSKHYPSEGILSRTGDLRRSLTDRFGPNAVYEADAQSLVLGTTLFYAKIHDHTDGPGTGKIPYRPPIGLRPTDPDLMTALALIQFERYAEALGFETKAA
jgi:phage gpG-like protein